MRTSDFQFELPTELIAQRPPVTRTASRMMVLDRNRDTVEHARFTDLGRYLAAGDLVILNDTRVFPARVRGTWDDTGGRIELLLLEVAGGASAGTGDGGHVTEWTCLCGSGRRVRPGLAATLGRGELHAEVVDASAGEGRIVARFRSRRPLLEVLEQEGEPPVPPYISRRDDSDVLVDVDRERYQTVYARERGAVAAPTAGLHFDAPTLTSLAAAGVELAYVTLHVGPGTFRPVKAERVEDHRMDPERYQVPETTAAAVRACRRRGGRILAVGSTTVRTLETMAAEHDGEAVACAGRSRLFIREPHVFRFTDRMLTNFHLPCSTLIMMVSALAGRERILAAYREAVTSRYRFYSYGDCMLIV